MRKNWHSLYRGFRVLRHHCEEAEPTWQSIPRWAAKLQDGLLRHVVPRNDGYQFVAIPAQAGAVNIEGAALPRFFRIPAAGMTEWGV